MVGRLVGRSIAVDRGRSAGRSVDHSWSIAVSRSRSVNRSQSVDQSVGHSQSIDHSRSVCRSIDRSRSVGRSVSWSQSVNRSQSVGRSVAINQLAVYCVYWRIECVDLAAVSWCIALTRPVLIQRLRSTFPSICLAPRRRIIATRPSTWHTASQARCCTESGACVIWNMPCRL